MSAPYPLKLSNKDQQHSRSLPNEQKNQFPVRAPNQKLKDDTSKAYFVKSISSMPLVFEMSKEELRINYMHSKSQGKLPDNRFSQPPLIPHGVPSLGLPRTTPPLPFSSAPSQVVATGMNPFMKTIPQQQFQPQLQKPLIPSIPQQVQNNVFSRQNNNTMGNFANNFTNNINRNPFGGGNFVNNQFQNNQSQYQSRNMFGNTSPMSNAPGLIKQTSFGKVAQTTGTFNAPSNNPLAPNQPQSQPFQQQATGVFGQNVGSFPTGQTSLQVPGQITQSPSFGNLGQTPQAPPSTFGQPTQTQGIFGGQTGNQPQSVFQTTLSQPANPIQPVNQPQNSQLNLDQNIKQLLESKPNLWNILALDPEFKYGFNQYGRIYVKSVLQRIIDENIISGQSLNKIIIEIYKQMYGSQNFQKILENKKNQLKSFDQLKTTKIDQMLAKKLEDKNVKSVFPEDINTLDDNFYRSFKRIPAKSRDSKIFIDKDDNIDKFRMQRKILQVKKPQKPLEVKFKFIEIKKQVDGKKSQSPYTSDSLEKIAQNITEIRKQQRKQIMPTEQDLPNIEGFTIVPSFDVIKTFTKHQLLSVPKVTISNQWGSVRFKAPICLLRKILKDCIIINQKTVEIIDQEWKVRQAEITFKKFADFTQLQEDQQNELQEKIVSWCEKQKFELIKVDRERGQVVIQI